MAVWLGHKEVPVTQLRKQMLEELERRNYTDSTKPAYLRIVAEFARHFHRPPDQLGPEQIREYIAHLFRDRKLSDNSVNQVVGGFREDAEATLECAGYAIPEKEDPPAGDLEPG
jgi:hypothetical protein